MNKRRLGKSGLEVTEIGLGCWQLGGDFGPVGDHEATEILTAAFSGGVNFWDTADGYGSGLSEQRIGEFLRARSGVHVATKVGRGSGLFPDHYSKAGVRASLEGSARRLKVETIDLAQLHCVPKAVLEDGQIFGWMDEFQKDGLVGAWGASVETIEEGFICLEQPGLATLQIIFNLFRQDAAEKLLPAAADADVGIIVRLPLASGLLSGKFGANSVFAKTDHRNYNRDGAAFSVGETFSGIAFDKGVDLTTKLKGMVPEDWPMAHMALRWILDHEQVSSVIAGVTKPAQLEDNIAAAGRLPLDWATNARLEEFYTDEVRPLVRSPI